MKAEIKRIFELDNDPEYFLEDDGHTAVVQFRVTDCPYVSLYHLRELADTFHSRNLNISQVEGVDATFWNITIQED